FTSMAHLLISTLFPYTTLFRSYIQAKPHRADHIAVFPWPNPRFLENRIQSVVAINNIPNRCSDIAFGPVDHWTKFDSKHYREWRSEEHTSELQSRENLVCRLLL